MAAARASFSTTTGRPRRDSSAAFSGKSRHPRFTARVTVPCAGSTRPGTPTPMARSSARSRLEVASASSRQATIASAAPSWSPTEEDRVARPRTAPEASTTRTAILVPPMSTPATRPPLGTLAVVMAGDPRAVCSSSLDRQPELAGQQEGAGADERQVLAAAAVDDPGLARQRAEAAAGRLVADRVEPG